MWKRENGFHTLEKRTQKAGSVKTAAAEKQSSTNSHTHTDEIKEIDNKYNIRNTGYVITSHNFYWTALWLNEHMIIIHNNNNTTQRHNRQPSNTSQVCVDAERQQSDGEEKQRKKMMRCANTFENWNISVGPLRPKLNNYIISKSHANVCVGFGGGELIFSYGDIRQTMESLMLVTMCAVHFTKTISSIYTIKFVIVSI